MARRRRSLDSFPKQFRTFVEMMQEQDVPFVAVEKRNDQITLRSQFYQFFAAAREEADKWTLAAKKTKNWADAPWYVDVAQFAAVRQIQIMPNGLKFIPKSQNNMAMLLEASFPEGWREKVKREGEEKMAEGVGYTQEDINDIVKARGEEFARNFGAPESMIEEAKRVAAGVGGV